MHIHISANFMLLTGQENIDINWNGNIYDHVPVYISNSGVNLVNMNTLLNAEFLRTAAKGSK